MRASKLQSTYTLYFSYFLYPGFKIIVTYFTQHKIIYVWHESFFHNYLNAASQEQRADLILTMHIDRQESVSPIGEPF